LQQPQFWGGRPSNKDAQQLSSGKYKRKKVGGVPKNRAWKKVRRGIKAQKTEKLGQGLGGVGGQSYARQYGHKEIQQKVVTVGE